MARISGPTRESKRVMAKGALNRVGGVGGGLLTAYSGIAGYNDARSNGSGVVGAATQGLTDAFLIDLIGWKAYLGGALAIGGVKAGVELTKSAISKSQDYNRMAASGPFSANTFVDSEQAYTMRQAGMTMIQHSAMNTKKATMGNEAMMMHR